MDKGLGGADAAREVLLSRQSLVPFRRAVAILCMALAAMLSGQTYISLMDRIDHAQNHAHFANPLAGDVAYSSASHASPSHRHDGHEPQKTAHHHEHGSAGHSHPHGGTADHQHGDAAIVFLAAQSFVLTACPLPALRCDTASAKLVSFNPRGPDHPPKTGLEIRV